MELIEGKMEKLVSISASLKQARGVIYSTNLKPVMDRLVDIEGWSKTEALEVIEQYRNYLFLRRKYPSYNLPPSKDIDEAWHAHVLHTQDYRNFCKQVFSHEEDQYLDHHPHIAKEGSLEELNNLFERTQNLYYQEFGKYIYQVRQNTLREKFLAKIREFLIAHFPRLAGELSN